MTQTLKPPRRDKNGKLRQPRPALANDISVEMALMGMYSLSELNMRERYITVRHMLRNGRSTKRIAEHLNTTERAVQRWRRMVEDPHCRWAPRP